MEYIIGVAVFLVVFFVGGILIQKSNEKKAAERIKNSFGMVPELEYSYEKYESIGYYFREMAKKHPEDAEHTVIDDITWHDLDMDKVYITMNATQSSIGEEYLYYLLRTPELNEEKLKKREELIEFFSKNAEKRVELQSELHKAGRINNVSVYEYLSRLGSVRDESNFKHIMCIVLLLASVLSIVVVPVIGIVALFMVFFYNIF